MTRDNQSAEIESVYQQITDLCAQNGGATKPMVDKLYALFTNLSESRAIAELEKLKVAFDTDRKTFDFSPATYDFIIDKRLAELKERNE